MQIRSLALAAMLMATSAFAAEPEPLSKGQAVYVPVYSHINHGNLDTKGKPQQLLLSTMLSVRNVDPDDGLVVKSVRYYDTAGKMLREYLPAPAKLGPMASTEFFVEHKDSAGGSGANFVVEWSADKPVNTPIIETVNAYFFGPHSMAFTSPGKAIRADK